MNIINVALGERSYSIYIKQGILEEIGDIIFQEKDNAGQSQREGKKAIIVTNESIGNYYLENITQGLEKNRVKVSCMTVREGEPAKQLQEVEDLCRRMIALSADRQTTLFALGGGVIGDLAGFTASVYMRGIPFIQVPTSLLAMVDSSVGGKTGVNLPEGKNLVGAFYQPAAVFIDPDTIISLPNKELRAGFAEVVKYGIIEDESFFYYLEEAIDSALTLNLDTLVKIIVTSCKIKASVVERDERESHHRAILNFGHTIGHAIEALTGYTVYKHGEALSIGMVCAASLSKEMGMASEDDGRRIKMLLNKIGLPTKVPDIGADDIIQSLYHDKKAIAGKIKFVLMNGIGNVEIRDDIPLEKIRKSLEINRSV